MAVSVPTLVKRVRRELQDEPWEDLLSAAVAAAGTATVSVVNPSSWAEGDRMEFDDDTGDVARVKSTANGANPVPIKRGHNGSTAIGHADASTVVKNPAYEYNAIVDAVNDAIAALWPDAWVAVAARNLVPVAGVRWYAATAGTIGLLSVKQVVSGTTLNTINYGKRGSRYPVAFELRHPSFSDGPAIGFPSFYSSTINVRVVEAAKVDTTTVTDGDMAKFVVMDACRRLLEGEDVERGKSDTRQGDVGVAVGSLIRNAAWFHSMAEKARRDTALQCKRDAPLMRPWGA